MATARRVRRLHLRGSDGGAVARGALLVEDAIRTASLPLPEGRVVVVRRLDLGPIAPGTSAARISRRVEEALEDPGLVWRHGLDDRAVDGDVVWFNDTVEAHLSLARRLRSGRTADEWFWPLAVRTDREGLNRDDAVERLRESLSSGPEGKQALACFDAAIAAEAAEAAKMPVPEARDPVAAEAAGDVPADSPFGLRRPRQPASESARIGSVEATPGAVEQSLGAARPPPQPEARGARGEPGGSSGPSRASVEPVVPDAPARRPAPDAAEVRGAPAAVPPGAPSTIRWNGPGGAVDHHQTASPWPHGGGEPTAAAGLLFLVNALDAIGYPEWLARHPEWVCRRIGQRMLLDVLRRQRLTPDDPLGRFLETAPAGGGVPDRFEAPPRWSPALWRGRREVLVRGSRGLQVKLDPSGRLPLAAEATGDAALAELDHVVVGAWSTAARRWLRRASGIGAASLVRRPARVIIGRTHVDAFLVLGQCDLRVRRAGLDLDPGWVPWLGRVVTFHYLPGETP